MGTKHMMLSVVAALLLAAPAARADDHHRVPVTQPSYTLAHEECYITRLNHRNGRMLASQMNREARKAMVARGLPRAEAAKIKLYKPADFAGEAVTGWFSVGNALQEHTVLTGTVAPRSVSLSRPQGALVFGQPARRFGASAVKKGRGKTRLVRLVTQPIP